MALAVTVQVQGGKANLSLSGRFDFSAHGEFRRTYEEVMKQEGVKGLDVDLGGVDYIDSSALGMLLLLKESADRAKHPLALVNCRGAVRRVLEVANFTKLFTLH